MHKVIVHRQLISQCKNNEDWLFKHFKIGNDLDKGKCTKFISLKQKAAHVHTIIVRAYYPVIVTTMIYVSESIYCLK